MSDDAHFRLRIPRHLKEWVDEQAKASNRSINSEIIHCIEQGAGNSAPLADFLREEVSELEMQIQAMKAERAEQSAQAMEYAKRGSDVLAGAILQMEIRSLTSRLLEAESRLRRIKRALKE